MDKLGQNFPNPGTNGSITKERSLRKQYPPLKGITFLAPYIIVDMQGIILTWYLPEILSESRQASVPLMSGHSRKPNPSQNAMLVAWENLGLLVEILKTSKSWCNDAKNLCLGRKGALGLVNLSPAWFQKGHDVSVSAHKPYLAAHFKLGNIAAMPAGFCKLQISCCRGLAKCHLRIKHNFECNPSSNSPQPL
jgi:hypothetical protein